MAENTYIAVGNKEDISDIITNIAPSDTPLHSRLRRTKAIATKHEWLEDTLEAPAPNAWPEGFTFFTRAPGPRTRLDNYTQIMSRGLQVTETQEVVGKHGVKSEMGYQMANDLKVLAMECELALLTQSAKVPGSMTPPVARQFGGLPYWIVTHVLDNGGSLRALTFDLINNALQDVWRDGGKPKILLVSPANKRVVSSFTAGNTKFMEGNTAHKLSQYIDVLETDFGRMQVLIDKQMPDDRVYGLSLEYMAEAVLRKFKIGDMPKISDAERKYVVGEWTLEMRAEKSHFAITDLDGLIPAA